MALSRLVPVSLITNEFYPHFRKVVLRIPPKKNKNKKKFVLFLYEFPGFALSFDKQYTKIVQKYLISCNRDL